MTPPITPSPGDRETIARTIRQAVRAAGPLWSDEEVADAILSGPFALLLADNAALRGKVEELRVTNRDLHRRAQKAESFRQRWFDGTKYAIRRMIEARRLQFAAKRSRDAAIARAEEAERALEAESEALQEEIELHAEVAAELAKSKAHADEAERENVRLKAKAKAANAGRERAERDSRIQKGFAQAARESIAKSRADEVGLVSRLTAEIAEARAIIARAGTEIPE